MSEENNFTERATDPRLEQTPIAASDPVEPIVDPVDNGSDEGTPETPPVIEEPVKPPKKTAEEVLKGRVGHLTKTLSNKDQAFAAKEQELADYKARLAAAESLLSSGGQQQSSPTPVAPLVANGNTTYTKEDFDAAVTAEAEVKEFNRKADEMYNQGATKFQDWKDSVETLVAAGFMNRDLIDAAMAVEDGTTVLHHLGTNLDEAERINALSPIRKAAEMAKLSNVLNKPQSTPVSNAPTPIRPVSGSPTPQVDLQRVADTDDMKAYVAARAKTGARWAVAGGTR